MNDKMITLARFQYSTEAQIIKGRIESEGIEAFLTDQYTIDTDPLVSNAIGGVKLKVWKQDKKVAEEVLQSISEFSLDDERNAIECPKCKSEKVRYYTSITGFRSFFSFIICLFVVVLPLYVSYKYRCENCNQKFNIS